jgi:lipopolysaccharide transport system ATP-binding protein
VAAIHFEDVWKYYPMYRHLTGGFKRFLLHLPEAVRGLRSRQVLALKEITFQVAKGESVGIIGDNGAGKSTLLGLMAGVLTPSRGRIVVDGRISALLDLGAGFHPELTGRENVILNGVLLGLHRRDVLRKMKAIIEFAELWEWIDQPTRTYSTGMVARLGFSVVAHLEPDILLIDEILAVGDARFQQKCLRKMEEFKRQGVTIVLVSHALGDITAICDRAIWIDDHQIAQSGAAEEVVQAYRTKVGVVGSG